MNRPIDWKKISELKRQAPPPEVPFGDMLSELLESETGIPDWETAATEEVKPPGPGFDTLEPVYPIAPNLEIHSEVEMALSELSENTVRYAQIESAQVAEYKEAVSVEVAAFQALEELTAAEVPVAIEAEATIATNDASAIEAPAFAGFVPVPPAQSEPAAMPHLSLPKPAPFLPFTAKTPPPLKAPASNSEVEDLLAMLLGSESAGDEEPIVVISETLEMPPAAPAPAAAAKTDEPAQPAASSAESCPDLDELISAMDREVDRSPFVEKTGDSTRSAPEPLISRESCLVFSLAGAKFGIPIHQVVELDKLPRVTPVPNVPYWVRGVTNLRGEILSVLDLRILLGMECGEHLDRGRILVVRLGEDVTAALIVDEVSGISNYAHDRLTLPAAAEGEKVIALLDGVYSSEELALKILNMDRLMATPELRQLEAA